MDFESGVLDSDTGPDMYGDDDYTPAHQAATTGDLQLLVKAIKQDPSVIQQRDGDGYTPLSHAVLGKHMNIVKRLVKMGADVNVQDDNGRTCLSVAAYQGWSDGVIYLLRKGARPDIVDKSGRTPLHAATYDTDTRSLIAILKRLGSEDEINVGDNERMTALHWASFHDSPDHVRQLLHRGAKCTLTDIDGKTPLHWAAQNGSSSCCFVLVEECPDLLTAIDNSGKTAVHLASAAGHSTVLHELASLAPSTSETFDKDDRTPLHWAAATGKSGCVRALLNLGVTRNPRDIDGVTPLEYATNAGHKDCVTLLQERPRSIPSTKGNKAEDNSSKPGFFKGLFTRKKPDHVIEKSKDEPTKFPDVVQSKHNVTMNKNNKRNEIDKENSNLTDDSTVDDQVNNSEPRCSSSVEEVNARPSDAKKIININGKLEALTLTGGVEIGKRKRKRKKKQNVEADSKDKPSTLNDNSNNTSPASQTTLTPLDASRLSSSTSTRLISSRGSNDSVSARRHRDLSPLVKADSNKESADKSKLMVSTSALDPESNRATPVPPLPFSITGKLILPEIRTGNFIPDTRSNTSVKQTKKFQEVTDNTQKQEQASGRHGVGIYTPQDRGRNVKNTVF